MEKLFDSHTHLTDRAFGQDKKEVCERIEENDIGYVMDIGCDLESSLEAIKNAARYDWCYATVGCHPHDAKSMDEDVMKMFAGLAKKPKVKAIGEIGLDYYYDYSKRDVQQYWFTRFIRLAKELKMPIVIHDRDAHEDTLRILKEEKAFETKVLMHCYSGALPLAKQYIALGAMISVAGTITFKNNKKQVEVVREIPLESLLIETDAPYLTPEPFRGKRNEPSYVRYTAEMIAQIKNLTFDEIARQTTLNGKKFYAID